MMFGILGGRGGLLAQILQARVEPETQMDRLEARELDVLTNRVGPEPRREPKVEYG
jgi:hypothetical protein